MAKIADVAAYVCKRYPHKHELSKTRLTKLVYLADWESAQKNGRQITEIEWYFHNFGPYVDDVIQRVNEDKRFVVSTTLNHYGDKKTEVRLIDESNQGDGLEKTERDCIDAVIEKTSRMYWNDFIKHVYSTAPISRSDRYSNLNLVKFAERESNLA